MSEPTLGSATGGSSKGARNRDSAAEWTASEQEAEAVHRGSRASSSADFGDYL